MYACIYNLKQYTIYTNNTYKYIYLHALCPFLASMVFERTVMKPCSDSPRGRSGSLGNPNSWMVYPIGWMRTRGTPDDELETSTKGGIFEWNSDTQKVCFLANIDVDHANR